MSVTTRNDQTSFILGRLKAGPLQREDLVAEAVNYVNPEEAATYGKTYLPITNPANRAELDARKRAIVNKVIQNQIVHGSMIESMAGTLYLLEGGYADKMRRVDMVPIQDIEVGTRLRTDLGDCASLAKSIEEMGLLHPIILVGKLSHQNIEARSLQLAAGARRLEAFRLLKLATIPARVFDSMADVPDEEYIQALDATENVQRLAPAPKTVDEMCRILDEKVAQWQSEARSAQLAHLNTPNGRKPAPRTPARSTATDSKDDKAKRTDNKAAKELGLSVRDARALMELHERALGKNVAGDPKGWKPDFSDMQIAQGLIGRIEKGELTYQQGLRELRQWFKEARERERRAAARPPAPEPSTAVDKADVVVAVIAESPAQEEPPVTVAQIAEPEPVAEPVTWPSPRLEPLVLERPLDAKAAKAVLAACDADEVAAFVRALMSSGPVPRRKQLRALICGED